MAQITFLGTAASIPSKARDNTSFVFTNKKESFLVDCPGSTPYKLLNVNIDFRKIKNIIITHHHPDHIYGITSLIHAQAFRSNEPITILSSTPSIKIIKKLTELFHLNRNQFPRIKFIDVYKTPVFFKNQDTQIQAIPNKHTVQSFGIKFSFGKKALLYSSDTCFSLEMLEKASPFDYLIHDCTASSSYFKKYPAIKSMHTHSRQLARYLHKHSDLKLIPVHFLTVEKNEEKRIRKELSICKKQVVWVKDGQRIQL